MFVLSFATFIFLRKSSILNLLNLENHFSSSCAKIRSRAVLQSVLPVDVAVPCFTLKTYLQERERDSANRFFDQLVRDGVLVVYLKPYWREARIDASLVSYQESFDMNPGMNTDSRHRKHLFFKSDTFRVSNRRPSCWCNLWQPSGGFPGRVFVYV